MTLTPRHIIGCCLLFVGVLLVAPLASAAQEPTVESDPSVVEVLPKNYPLNRIRVAAQAYPWSAIGLLTMLQGRYTCTGTLISERYVLTAAHCVFPVRRFPSEINFLAGYEQDRYVAHSKAKRVHLSKGFKNHRPSLTVFADDWALVELEKPVGRKAGYLGWAHFDRTTLGQMGSGAGIFKVSGYRRDRRFVQTVDHNCAIVDVVSNDRVLVHQCPITGGDSGGPILLPYQDQLLVVGIDVGMKGKPDPQLKRGEARNGYAVPSAAFRDRLIELGIGGGPMDGSDGLTGRVGKAP